MRYVTETCIVAHVEPFNGTLYRILTCFGVPVMLRPTSPKHYTHTPTLKGLGCFAVEELDPGIRHARNVKYLNPHPWGCCLALLYKALGKLLIVCVVFSLNQPSTLNRSPFLFGIATSKPQPQALSVQAFGFRALGI